MRWGPRPGVGSSRSAPRKRRLPPIFASYRRCWLGSSIAAPGHVLHVTHRYWPFIGGSEQYVASVAERWVGGGGASSVYTSDAWDLEYLWARGHRRIDAGRETHNGVQIARLPVVHRPLTPWLFEGRRRLARYLPAPAWPVARWLSEGALRLEGLDRALAAQPFPFQLVHGWNITLDALLWPALRAARRAGVPFVVTPFAHVSEQARERHPYTSPHQVHLLAAADRVIALTRLEADTLSGLGIDRRRIVVAEPGIEPGELLGGDPTGFRRRHQVAERFLFAFIGALSRDKGVYDAIAAVEGLRRRGRDARLVLAGPSDSRFEGYWAQAPEDIRRACLYLGYVDQAEKRDLLAAADLLLLPSCTESFGIVFLEAWANGKPVIGAASGAVSGVIADGIDGFLVPFGDVDALSGRIARLMDDPASAAAMGEVGRQKVLGHYTWNRTYHQISQVYRELL